MAIDTDVHSEVVAQETSQLPEETLETQKTESPSEKVSDKDLNLKRQREVIEAQKRELEQLKEKERLFQEEFKRLAGVQTQISDELEKIAPDDILTASQAERLAERKFKKLFEEFEDQKGEEKVRHEYTDYDAIVTQENLERLKSEHPEVVETLKMTPKLYLKAKTAYKLLKSFYGTPELQQNRENLEKNLSKPRSVNSLGATGALSQASAFERGLTADLKKQLLNEMVESAKRS